VILFFLFGLATILFFWKFPAWLYYATLGEVAGFYLYTALTEALEGLVYLTALLFFCIALPASWFRDRFIVRGPITALALPTFLLLTQYFIAYHEFGKGLAALLALLLAGGLACLWMWLAARSIVFERAARLLAERAPVFLPVYLPLAAIALVVLAARNLG
jgi:hypothetical protein